MNRSSILVISLLLYLFSTPLSYALTKDDLAKIKIGSGEAHWLKDDKGEFLSILDPAQTMKPKGSIILLPDQGQHALWSILITPLRQYLSQHGWRTLTISLPRLKEAPKPEEKGKPATLSDPISAQVAKRIDAAESFLLEKKVTPILIISYGSSVAWAQEWVQKNQKKVKAYVLISPYWPWAYNSPFVTLKLTELEPPVLDIRAEFDKEAVKIAAFTRQRIMRASEKKNYAWRELIGVNEDYSHAGRQLGKTITAWLNKQPIKDTEAETE